MNLMHSRTRALHDQRGFTLIEILIALMIGVFLLGALVTIVQANRTVFGNQNKLSQLQDGERMALTLITDVIQSAGYFPDPTTNTLTTTLTGIAPFGVGQSVYGIYSAAPPGDQISVRYMTAGGDGILNCSGQSNPTGGPNTLYVNTFQILERPTHLHHERHAVQPGEWRHQSQRSLRRQGQRRGHRQQRRHLHECHAGQRSRASGAASSRSWCS